MGKRKEYEVASEEFLMAKVMRDDALAAFKEVTGTQELLDVAISNYKIKRSDVLSKREIYRKYCLAGSSLNLPGVSLSISLDESVVDIQNYQEGTLNRQKLIDMLGYLADSIFDIDTDDRVQTFEDVRLDLQSQADAIEDALASVI